MTERNMDLNEGEDLVSLQMEIPSEQMQMVFGASDKYVRKLEQNFNVTIVDRNGKVAVKGRADDAKKAKAVLDRKSVV